MTPLIVGLIADTHIPYRMKRLPNELFEALASVDIILHAGDVDDPEALEPLRRVAPVHAVRGNFHLMDFSDGGASLPAVLKLHLAERSVVLTHGHWPGLLGFGLKWWDLAVRLSGRGDQGLLNELMARRLARLYPDADVIAFGHSHRPYLEWKKRTLLINPGAVCPTRGRRPTIARLELGQGKPRAIFIPLHSTLKPEPSGHIRERSER